MAESDPLELEQEVQQQYSNQLGVRHPIRHLWLPGMSPPVPNSTWYCVGMWLLCALLYLQRRSVCSVSAGPCVTEKDTHYCLLSGCVSGNAWVLARKTLLYRMHWHHEYHSTVPGLVNVTPFLSDAVMPSPCMEGQANSADGCQFLDTHYWRILKAHAV